MHMHILGFLSINGLYHVHQYHTVRMKHILNPGGYADRYINWIDRKDLLYITGTYSFNNKQPLQLM